MSTEPDRQPRPVPSEGLTVRRFERHELSLPVQVTLDESSPVSVRLGRSTGNGSSFNASLVDLGQGGLGLESPCFLPRQCLLRVKLTADPGNLLPEFEAKVRVMRTRMSSKEPRYALGCSFADPSAGLQQLVEDVLAAIAAQNAGEAA